MPRAEDFISLHADTSVHHPSLLLTQIPVPWLVLPIPVGREPGATDTMCQGGCRDPASGPQNLEEGGRAWGLKKGEERGWEEGDLVLLVPSSLAPCSPSRHPGLHKCPEEIVPRVCLGPAQRLPLDCHSLPPTRPESPAAATTLFHLSVGHLW